MKDYLPRQVFQALEVSKKIRFSSQLFEHRVIMALYARIIEQTHEAAILLLKSRHASLDVILRSTFEAFADLINVCRDSSYISYMEAAYHKEWIKLADAGVTGSNPYLLGFATPAIIERLKEHRTKLNVLESQGFRALNNFERFERAGLSAEYRSIYNSLCAASHNNLRELVSHHIREDDGIINVVLFEDAHPEDLAVAVDGFVGILTAASHEVNNRFGNPADDNLNIMEAQRAELREALDD